jgi:anti-sigma factor RsiW
MPTAETSAPTRVGDNALVRRIGAGGMGEVWLGRHVVSGSPGDAAARARARRDGHRAAGAHAVGEPVADRAEPAPAGSSTGF